MKARLKSQDQMGGLPIGKGGFSFATRSTTQRLTKVMNLNMAAAFSILGRGKIIDGHWIEF